MSKAMGWNPVETAVWATDNVVKSSGVTTGGAAGAGAPGPRGSRGPFSRLSFTFFSTATSLLK